MIAKPEHEPPKEKTGQPLTWQDIWTLTVARPSVQTFERILADPTARTTRAYAWVFFAGLLNGLVSAILLQRSGLPSMPAELGGGPIPPGALWFSVLLSGPIMIVALVIGAGIMHLIASRFFGAQGVFGDFVYVYGAIVAPLTVLGALVAVVPLGDFLRQTVSIVLLVYQFMLTAFALKAVYGFATAAAATIVGAVTLLGLLLLSMFGAALL